MQEQEEQNTISKDFVVEMMLNHRITTERCGTQ